MQHVVDLELLKDTSMPDSRLCSRVYPSSAWRRTTDTPLMARMVEEQEKHSTGCGHELRLKVGRLKPKPQICVFPANY